MPQSVSSTYTNRQLLLRFWPYLKKYRKTIALDLFCAALTCLCDLGVPLGLRAVTSTAVE